MYLLYYGDFSETIGKQRPCKRRYKLYEKVVFLWLQVWNQKQSGILNADDRFWWNLDVWLCRICRNCVYRMLIFTSWWKEEK